MNLFQDSFTKYRFEETSLVTKRDGTKNFNGYGNTNTNKFCQLLTGWGTYWFPSKQINIPETQTCVLKLCMNEKEQ